MGDDRDAAGHEPHASHNFTVQVPAGEDRERLVCEGCGYILYENPKIVVGLVSTWEGRVLLCRRAIEPRVGFWTLPAGYLELGESPEVGACREAREEAHAEAEIDQLLAVYSVESISQVQLFYRARLTSPDVTPGPESQDVALFRWEDVPWPELAFPTVRWALQHHHAVRDQRVFAPFSNPPGASANFDERRTDALD